MKELFKIKLTLIEKFTITFIIILIIIGDIGAFINVHWYETKYAGEDGFIEWLTSVPLLIATVAAISYLVKLTSRRSWLFFLTALFGLHRRWRGNQLGQRIFHIQTPEYFKEHNAQDEMNIHNLVLSDGKKVNKVIFSQLLSVLIGIYLILLPILYIKVDAVK